VKVVTATISAIFLTPGWVLSLFAVLGAQGDALAVALHREDVAGGEVGGAQGALVVEVGHPASEVVGDLGDLGEADGEAGALGDDLLGLAVAAGRDVVGDQGAHPEGVGVLGERPAGVGGVEVRLTAVAVREPGHPDRTEDTGHAPVVAGLGAAVADPCLRHQILDALLAGGVEGEGGLQQRALQFPAVLLERLLPLAVVERAGALERPTDQRGVQLVRPREQGGGLGVHRDPAAVLVDQLDRHHYRHRRASAPSGTRAPTSPMILEPDEHRRTRRRAASRRHLPSTARQPPTCGDHTPWCIETPGMIGARRGWVCFGCYSP
jgi:hypothetical protein